MPTPYPESQRVKTFRLEIAKEIPKFPNDKITLQALEALSLGSLLIHYSNWMIRYVSVRPRTVSIEPTASSDSRWSKLYSEIAFFLEKVKNGEALTPHLSLEPHTRGYTLASAEIGSRTDKWADKDFLLNAMGYHHFHLGQTAETHGFAGRTNDLLFAKVSRDHFTVVAIFDHSVFERPTMPTEAMTKERERLWNIFDEHSVRGLVPGAVYTSTVIATSGHPVHLVRLASEYAHVVQEIEPKVDDFKFVKELYESAGLLCPKKPKLKWHLNFLNLGLLDVRAEVFFVFRYGPN